MKKKLRVGMIGYGFMGKAHTNAFRQAAKFFPDLPYEPELKMFCARKKNVQKVLPLIGDMKKLLLTGKKLLRVKK